MIQPHANGDSGVRNLTKLSEVMARDPNTGALLRRAQAIEDGWRGKLDLRVE